VDVERNELRRRLAQRQRQKAELERQFHAVQRQYQEQIAPLKEEVLRLQVERLRRAAQRHMRSARHRNAYHDAQRAYESYRENRSRSQPSAGTLKARYRQASKRCHPDVVPDAYHDQAAATFQALEAAYAAGHGRAVEAIADALERWGFPRDAGAANTDDRTRELGHLHRAIADLEESIQAIQGTDAYQELTQAGDLDALLRVQKERLLRRLRDLKRR
jgi:hypothetical protein